jgi:hypothetical protein
MEMRIALMAFAALSLASCRDRSPEQPTTEQSAQLNDAEDMLNGAANEEGPADRSASPSNSSE